VDSNASCAREVERKCERARFLLDCAHASQTRPEKRGLLRVRFAPASRPIRQLDRSSLRCHFRTSRPTDEQHPIFALRTSDKPGCEVTASAPALLAGAAFTGYLSSQPSLTRRLRRASGPSHYRCADDCDRQCLCRVLRAWWQAVPALSPYTDAVGSAEHRFLAERHQTIVGVHFGNSDRLPARRAQAERDPRLAVRAWDRNPMGRPLPQFPLASRHRGA